MSQEETGSSPEAGAGGENSQGTPDYFYGLLAMMDTADTLAHDAAKLEEEHKLRDDLRRTAAHIQRFVGGTSLQEEGWELSPETEQAAQELGDSAEVLLNPSLGTAIQRLCVRSTYDTIADSAGVGRNTIRNWINGTGEPKPDQLAAMERTCDVPAGYSLRSLGKVTFSPDQPMEDPVPLDEVMREEFARSGLLQKDLADMAGVSPVVISRWLKGENVPPVSKLLLLEEAMGLETGFLMYRAGWLDPVDIQQR